MVRLGVVPLGLGALVAPFEETFSGMQGHIKVLFGLYWSTSLRGMAQDLMKDMTLMYRARENATSGTLEFSMLWSHIDGVICRIKDTFKRMMLVSFSTALVPKALGATPEGDSGLQCRLEVSFVARKMPDWSLLRCPEGPGLSLGESRTSSPWALLGSRIPIVFGTL